MIDTQHDKFFDRMILMLQKLSIEKAATVVELSEIYGVSTKTIERDVDRLHFFPIERKKGIVSVTDGFDIERFNIQGIELLVAELALNSVQGIGKDIDRHLQSIRVKVSHPLFFSPYHIKADSFEPIDMDSELLNKMEDAIRKRNISKVTSNELVSVVEPYKVVAFDGIWYLLAKDTSDGKVKTYLVSNINEFRASTSVYADEYHNIDEMLSGVHTAWFEDGNSFEVKIKVKAEIAHIFKLKQHLASQKVLKENKDGSLIVTFNVSTDEDVDNLIKSWLPHIEVIKPERFRKKLVLELEEYVKELKELQNNIVE